MQKLIPGRRHSKCKDHESGSGSLRTSSVCWRESKKAGLTRIERATWGVIGVEGEVVDGPEHTGPYCPWIVF